MASASLEDDTLHVREYCDSINAYLQNPSQENRDRMCRTGEGIVARFYAPLLTHAKTCVNALTPPAEDMVQHFMEMLLVGEILCEYEGRNAAALKTYLFRSLRYRIIDEMRRGGIRGRNQMHLDPEVDMDSLPSSPAGTAPTHEEQLEQGQMGVIASRVLRRSLDVLSRQHPHDARLVLLKMEGVTNAQIVQRNLLGDAPWEETSGESLRKRENVVKTRYKRAKERLGIVIRRMLEKERVSIEDIRSYLGEL